MDFIILNRIIKQFIIEVEVFRVFSTNNNKESYFNTLNNDILSKIFLYLDSLDIYKFLFISKKCKSIADTMLLRYPGPAFFTQYNTPGYSLNNLDLEWSDKSGSEKSKWGDELDHFEIEVRGPNNIGKTVMVKPNIRKMRIPVGEISHLVYEPFSVTIYTINRDMYRTRGETVKVLLHDLRMGTGCIEPSAKVMLASGVKKCAKEINVGDYVMSGDKTIQKVLHVAYKKEKAVKNMVQMNGFLITRGHPVLKDGEWWRPDELYPSQEMEVDGLINFVLDGAHTILVGEKDEEVVCATLGKYCGPRLAALYPKHNELYHHNIVKLFSLPIC